MAPHPTFAATVMLDSLRQLDTDDLTDLLEAYMESRNSVAVSQTQVQTGDFAFRIGIDGAHVSAVFVDNRYHPPRWPDGFEQCQTMDVEPVLTLHRAHVRVSRASRQAGLSALKANAALVSIVAAGIGMQLSARGVLFEDSGTLHDAVSARRAGLTAIRGVSPIEAWVGVCPISIDGRGGPPLQGAVTRGLRGLIGREIEIAPAPGTQAEAVRRLEGMAWRVLDGELTLREGDEVSPSADGEARLNVHDTDAWLRPGVPAHVLVAPDAAVEIGTLVPKAGFGRTRPPSPGKASLGTSSAELLHRIKDGLSDRQALEAAARTGLGRALALARRGGQSALSKLRGVMRKKGDGDA